MLEVEGKTFHKLVEKKSYRTELYHNFCHISQKDTNNLGYKNLLNLYVTKMGIGFFLTPNVLQKKILLKILEIHVLQLILIDKDYS